jgi:alpha-glucoside transport system substrate-binding protein
MRRRAIVTVLVAAGAMTVTGCVGSGDVEDSTAEPVTVFGPYRGTEADRFAELLATFTDRTGIEVRYTGTADFVTDLLARTGEGNDPPDVAMVPQPGLVRQLAEDGLIVELPSDARSALERNYSDEAAELGEVDDVAVGVPFRVNVKSIVWYRPSVFEERGWQVPRSLDELVELTDRVAAEPDIVPWCLTLQAGSATGWPATDWVEDLVVRFQGPDEYAQWARGELPFESPPIRRAFETFDELVLSQGHLFGGRSYALDNTTDSLFEGLLGSEPGCAMAKQAGFAVEWLPDGTTIGPDGDVDWFLLPARSVDEEPPVVVGGDLAVQFRRDERVDALITFLAGDEAGASWARRGGLISPRSNFDPEDYPDDTARAFADLVVSADRLVFDASDLMPSDVGTTAYWSGISQWVAGQITFDQLAAALDARFEESLAGAVELPSDPDGP